MYVYLNTSDAEHKILWRDLLLPSARDEASSTMRGGALVLFVFLGEKKLRTVYVEKKSNPRLHFKHCSV